MFRATHAIDPQTGRHCEDPVPLLPSSDWRRDADRCKIPEGTVSKGAARRQVGARGSGTERQERGTHGTPGDDSPAAARHTGGRPL